MNNKCESAIRTLNSLGYKFKGGEYWKPSIGELPKFQRTIKEHRESMINLNCRCGDFLSKTNKEPESKEWPQVGDDALFECSESPKSHEDCNLDEHCIVDTWFNGDELVVVAIVTGFDGSLLPVVQNKRTKEVSTILKKLIKKQKTPEEELRDELWDDVCIDSITLSQANEIFETILAKYNITKKPQ